MKEETTYIIEFLNGDMSSDLIPTITRHFIKYGVSLQWYDDETKNNKSINGNDLVYLNLTFNRLYKYSLVFEVLDGLLRIPKGAINIAQEEFYNIMVGFINLINAHVKVYTNDNTLCYEYKNGDKIYDYTDKSFSQSTLLMLIDFYLAELHEALKEGNTRRISEINDSLNSYKLELNKF